MAFDRSVEEVIAELLSYYDVQGPRGSDLLPVRTTLLVKIKRVETHDMRTTLTIDQYAAEGFGIHSFWKSHMHIPEDTKVAEGLNLAWNTDEELPPTDQLIWLRRVVDLGSFPEHFTYDAESLWIPLRHPAIQPHVLHHLELFAGGFGGWTMALRLAMQQLSAMPQSVGIDSDPQAAKTFALTHHASFVQPVGMLPRNIFETFQGNWSVCADVLESTWCPAVATWGVDFATVSFPCQPWSGATDGPGLTDPIGQTLFHAVLQLRFLRPSCIGFENVPGFHRHPHKALLNKLLLLIGYRISWEATLDVRDHLGLLRARWLALATRVNGPAVALPLVPWPTPTHDIDHSRFAMQWNPDDQMLVLSQEAWTFASDKQYLSWKMIKNLPTKQDVLQSRTYGDHDILPTFMAMYGRQHELPQSHLAKFGYMAHFRQASNEWPYQVRYWHPAEIGMLHGALDCLFVDADVKSAWKIMGNLITVLHAGRVVLPALDLIFSMTCDRDEFLQQFHDRRIDALTAETTFTPFGMFLTPMDCHPTDQFLASVPILVDLHHDAIWVPEVGLTSFEQLRNAHQTSPQSLPLKQNDDSTCIDVSSDEATQLFDIMIKVLFNLGIPQRLDFSMDLPPECVEQFWFGRLQLCHQSPPLDCMDFRPRDNDDTYLRMFHDVTIPVIHQGTLQIFKADHAVTLCSQECLRDMPHDLFDLFGPLTISQKPNDQTLLLDFRFSHGSTADDLLNVFQNFARVGMKCHWDYSEDSYAIQLTGPKEFVTPVLNFWIKVIPQTMLDKLGRKMHVISESCGFQINYVPAKSVGVCPPQPFQFALAIAAFRTFMGSLPATHDAPCLIVLRWVNRTLWEGHVPLTFNVGIVLQFLKFAFFPILRGTECRLVFKGKQIPMDATLQELDWISTKECNRIAVIPAMSGGGPAKHQEKLCQQSAMAATLLEFGYELNWISSTCEQLINKFSLSKIQAITAKTSPSAKITSIIALCKEAGIDIPNPSKPTSKQQKGPLPWKAKRTKSDEPIQPQDYQLVPGFFTNQDGTPVQQIQTVKPQTAGLCMLLPHQAGPYLSGEQLSTDELGVLVIGAIPPSTAIDLHKVVFPCWNPHNQMVLITGYLVQLGARLIQVQKGDPEQVKAEACSLVAITAYRGDWNDDDWITLTTKPIPFLREVFAKSGMESLVLSIWGKSLRSGKSAASPHQADTMQVHCSVVSDKLNRFLGKSGFNGLYATPKQPDGRLDATFRIIWLSDDAQAASIQAMKTQNCLGLVRGKNTLGLRYMPDDYDKAWNLIHPGQDKPALVTGDLMYKLKAFRLAPLPKCCQNGH